MFTSLKNRLQLLALGLCSVFFMIVISACAGVAGTDGSPVALTGSIQTVNPTAHSVTLAVSANGQQQQYTVNGLTDQEVASLQANVGKTYTLQVNQNGNSYTITSNTTPQENSNATPGITTTTSNTTTTTTVNTGATTSNEPGSIDFIGKVQSANNNSVTVSMPNGDTLTVNLTVQTDRGDLLNGQISQGQTIKVDALANPADGSFVANKIGQVDNEDLQNSTKLNTVDFSGVTTSAVGSDNVIHLKVGNKAYSFTSSATTQNEDFANPQAIGNNQAIKVDVLYNGSAATVLKIGNANN